jgi:hypothetical protein
MHSAPVISVTGTGACCTAAAECSCVAVSVLYAATVSVVSLPALQTEPGQGQAAALHHSPLPCL